MPIVTVAGYGVYQAVTEVDCVLGNVGIADHKHYFIVLITETHIGLLIFVMPLRTVSTVWQNWMSGLINMNNYLVLQPLNYSLSAVYPIILG